MQLPRFRFRSILAAIAVLGVLTSMALSLAWFRSRPGTVQVADAVTQREAPRFRNTPAVIEGVDRMTNREFMEGEMERSGTRFLLPDRQRFDPLHSEPVSHLP
jgi:hypothetical protein